MSEAARLMAIQAKQKNLAVAVILVLFFGGLGLLYTSIMGGIVAIIVALVILVLGAITMGLGWFLFLPYWVVVIIYTIVSINKQNNAVVNEMMRSENRSQSAPAQSAIESGN